MKMPSGENLSITEIEFAIVLAQTLYKDVSTPDYIESLKRELMYKKQRSHNDRPI